MDEKDAIVLLGKLEKFMTATATAIKDLQIRVHNQQVDIDNFKKNQDKARIILSH